MDTVGGIWGEMMRVLMAGGRVDDLPPFLPRLKALVGKPTA